MSNVQIQGAGSLEQAVADILEPCEAVVKFASYEVSKKIAKEAARDVKSLSPYRKGGYSKGWKATAEEDGYVVHNARYPGLTHLLENGHDIVVNGQKVGHEEGRPHIKPVEENEVRKFEEQVKREVERRLGSI